jgi:3-hydroxyanthranilate 3,4-dioxygenase
MSLHCRPSEGKEELTVFHEDSVIYTPAGTPHSPRFASDAFALVLERRRQPGEIDPFQWFCPNCDNLLHEERFIVDRYSKDPVSWVRAKKRGDLS